MNELSNYHSHFTLPYLSVIRGIFDKISGFLKVKQFRGYQKAIEIGNSTVTNSSTHGTLNEHDCPGEKFRSKCGCRSKYEQKYMLLLKENDRLRKDVGDKLSRIDQLIKSEEQLRSRLTSYAKKEIDKNGKFEDINQSNRSTKLIQEYNILYSQTRLDALDNLIGTEIVSERLKSRILFSIIVVSFRVASIFAHDLRNQVRKLLQINSKTIHNDFDSALNQYLKATADTFDITKIEKTVESQLWTVLYDYPKLRESKSLNRYLSACCRVTWSLVNQTPAYRIDICQDMFDKDLHERFHTSSDENCKLVQEYVWPSLIDLLDNKCVSKGIVITRNRTDTMLL
ncbi:hypothetical protein GJ496_008821 [Pomphorhynchus laevis]|nr:hypothetical protein GJ496_008821 [Pomphorhynchus laevis]